MIIRTINVPNHCGRIANARDSIDHRLLFETRSGNSIRLMRLRSFGCESISISVGISVALRVVPKRPSLNKTLHRFTRGLAVTKHPICCTAFAEES
jgi:hypothetical protein